MRAIRTFRSRLQRARALRPGVRQRHDRRWCRATEDAERINAARVIAERCEWNSEHCEHGLDGLREWAYEYNEELKEFSKEPRHDWASHPGDAFSYGAQMMVERVMPTEKPKPLHPHHVVNIFGDVEKPRSRYRG